MANLINLSAPSALKRLKFIGYDLNQLGPHDTLTKAVGDSNDSNFNIMLSPSKQRDKKLKLYRGELATNLEKLVGWLMKHVENKFELQRIPLSDSELKNNDEL